MDNFMEADELKKILSIPMLSEELKKGDIVELIDEKLGISKKCKVSEVKPIKNEFQSIVYLQALIPTDINMK